VAQPHTHRTDLPEGTVTLLFTDIEGSTQLLRALGGRYRDVQERHRSLLREAFARFDGVEVDTQGDSFMVAFRTAGDAVSAAIAAQRTLEAEPWPGEARVRVRMGLHTGAPERGPEGYVGMDVHVAARICAAAHGGQIVVSRATRDLVEEPDGVSFRPLGSHRLKDVPRAEELLQLLAPGLEDAFPPLRTLGGATLPALHHRLVGRRSDLTATLSLLARPDVRLVTIIGPGGAGKSRLALETAALAAVERPVHLVGLAPVADAANVLPAIASSLGVRESRARPLVDEIGGTLAGTRALLVLDNLEHLAAAAHDVAALLDSAHDLDVLATSRAPLRLSGEHVVPLEPLPVDDAATLFVELAAARGVVLRETATAAVREICRRLDGLPLAIELVAARLAVLPPEHLLRALDEGIGLDLEGPLALPERQRTLRATIAWSYALLGESQRRLQEALAVFAGGCTLEDARALAGAGADFYSDLEALASSSLVRTDVSDDEVRVSMLETVREATLSRLAGRGELDGLRRAHAELCLGRALEAEQALTGPDQGRWLERLERDLDNLRGALDWLLQAGRVEDALRAISSLERFWRAHGHVSEARRWLALGLEFADRLAPEVRAAALRTAAQQAAAQSDWTAAESLLEEALDLYRAGGQRREEVFTLGYLSFAAMRQGAVERAERYANDAVAVASELDDDRASSGALTVLGDIHRAKGENELAIARYEEAVALRRRLGDPLLVTDGIYYVGLAAFHGGDLARARREIEAALEQARSLGEEPYVAAAQLVLSLVDLQEGDAARAAERAAEALELYTHIEDDRSRARCLVVLAAAAAERGDLERAARLTGEATALRRDDPPDEYESPVLARYLPELEGRLGPEAVRALMERVTDERQVEPAIVTPDTRA